MSAGILLKKYWPRWNHEHYPKTQKKIIERLAKNIMEEKLAKIVINLDKQGYMLEAIAELADVSLDFVKKTLYR